MFGFEEGVEALCAQFASPSTVLGTTKWSLAGGRDSVIDRTRYRLRDALPDERFDRDRA